MRWLCALGFAAVMLTTTVPAFAVQPDEVLADSRLETRARTLSRELRCMVCQNQSIDDSDAPLARDLRLLVRERLKAGDSDTQIIDFLVARYGQFVLLRPRFEWETALLWLTPLLVLLTGLIAAGAAWRSRQRAVAGSSESVAPLSPAEEKRLAELVSGPDR
jgi:cytochrome c-type biogenesis protein CcmH